MTQLQTQTDGASRVLEVLVSGNLSALSPAERLTYYQRVCDSLGLNQFTKPFEFITLNGKLVLYATKSCTDQLRDRHGVSISDVKAEQQGDLYVVTVTATNALGRTDSDMGIVAIGNLKGENLANAMLKAVTKAKRRTTLSICGLGMLDETEIEDIPASAKKPPVSMPQPRQIEQPVDVSTGEIVDAQPEPRMWPAFWAKTKELGYSEAQVRKYVAVDVETFDAMTHADLQRVINELRAAASQQPALPA